MAISFLDAMTEGGKSNEDTLTISRSSTKKMAPKIGKIHNLLSLKTMKLDPKYLLIFVDFYQI